MSGTRETAAAIARFASRVSATRATHVLTARTLEICEDLGLGDALRQIAPPWLSIGTIPQVAGSGAGRCRSKQGVDFVQRRLAFCQCGDFSGF